MKNKFILRLSLLIIFTFFLHSCRSEDFLNDGKTEEQKYKVSVLNKEQINREKPLLKELSQVKSKFRYKANVGIDGKSAQNDILDGAIIGTNQALLVENNGVKTYTFPVSRTYLSRKTENLIVKENSDHTFSGVLIQYDLTKEQQQKFISVEITDIKSKINIYDIDKLNINTTSRVQTDVVGCYKITWETGWCSAGIHQTGSDNTCTVGGAPAPMILSIEETCSQTGGGGTGDGGLGQVGAGGVIDLGGYYNTLPFVSLGYQYYETEDPLDPNYVHYTNIANYFQSLGNTLNQLRVTNPDLFYYAFFYFKEKGITIKSKSFITERLTGLNAWYVKANSNPEASEMNNQYFLNWAFEYLVLNPTVTWQEFYNEYLATPCDKIKAQRSNADFYAKMNVLESNTGLKMETGYIQRNNNDYEYKDNATATETSNSLGLPNSDLPENKDIKGYMHTHVDDFTYTNADGDEVTRKGIKIFSPADVSYFMDMVKNAKDANKPLGEIYAVMVSGSVNYQIRFTGNEYQVNTFTKAQVEALRELYTDLMKDRIGNQKNLEIGFLKFLNDNMNVRGVSLYKMNSNGTNTEINLNADKTDTTETNCPN